MYEWGNKILFYFYFLAKWFNSEKLAMQIKSAYCDKVFGVLCFESKICEITEFYHAKWKYSFVHWNLLAPYFLGQKK
jgi:hypothetical protein